VATAIILPLGVALASVSQTALLIAYGEKYAGASVPLSILASLTIVSAYTSIYSTELQSVGKTKPILKAGVTSTLAYVALLATLAAPLKQVGAALARAMITIVSFTILYRSFGMRIPGNLGKSIMIAAILATILMPIELCLKTNVYVKALIEVLAFAIMLPITYKLIKPLDSEGVKLIKTMIPQRIRCNMVRME
jgi:O-antigen/teichoic acid export membrane protein